MSKETYFIYVGNAQGNVEVEEGERKGEKIPYFNMFVITPASDYTSEDYKAEGFKAEKKKCISAAVWKDLLPGEKCQLFFDDKGKVALASSIGEMISLS